METLLGNCDCKGYQTTIVQYKHLQKTSLITIQNDEQSEASVTHSETNFSNTGTSTNPMLEEFKDVFEGLGCLPGKGNLECDHKKPVQHTL